MGGTPADSGRAQRWRDEQQHWADLKSAHARERDAQIERDVVTAKSRDPEFVVELRSLRTQGATGAPGRVPAALAIISNDGSGLELKNLTPQALRVDAWRMFGGENGGRTLYCGLQALDRNDAQVSDSQIAPGGSLRYVNAVGEPCSRGARENPLAIEVRRDGKLLWLTDSRFAELLGVPPGRVDEVLAR